MEKNISGIVAIIFLSLVIFNQCCQAKGNEALNVSIVNNRVSQAEIIISAKASGKTRVLAREFAEYIKKSTGAVLPVLLSSDKAVGNEKTKIRFGRNALSKKVKDSIKFDQLGIDGFVIDVKPDQIILAGRDDDSTGFAAYKFLEKYVGVRWLMPGTLGEDIPKMKTLEIPVGTLRVKPAYFHRWISGVESNRTQADWLRHNRFKHHINFHHNLNVLLPVKKFGKTHPEYYPLINGKRFIPTKETNIRWQPCFSNPEVVKVIVANICKYIDEHPGTESVSLGINDGHGCCQCTECLKTPLEKKWFLGTTKKSKSFSNLYYSWCNKVIAEVHKKYPDIYFGCLAYDDVIQPPTNLKRLNSKMLPFITHDRMQWMQSGAKEMGQKITKKWAKVAPMIAWYDYIYGTPYMVPRVWFHTMGDYMQFGYEHNVRAYYAEAYANWSEGPKLYVLAKLLWDPYQNVDTLLDEWYVRAVGPESAKALRKYYQLWEKFWQKRAVHYGKWFGTLGYGCQYAFHRGSSYLDLVTDKDMETSLRLLHEAVVKAQTHKQKKRAKLLLKGFEFYALSYETYKLAKKCQEMKVDSEKDAKACIDTAIRGIRVNNQRRVLVKDVFAKDPILLHPSPHSPDGIFLRGAKGEMKKGNWSEIILRRVAKKIRKFPQTKNYIKHLIKKEKSPEIQKLLQQKLK